GFTGAQILPSALLLNDTIYVCWADARPPAANYFVYGQKLDTSGNAYWFASGTQINSLNNFLPYPKLAAAENGNFVCAFISGSKYRAEKIMPDSSFIWQSIGIPINTNSQDYPFYNDHVLVSSPNGTVASFWSSYNADICAAKIIPLGPFTGVEQLSSLNA